MRCNSSAYVVKSLSETRWYARLDVVRALKVNHCSIIKVEGVLVDDTEQLLETQADVRCIMYKLYALENSIMYGVISSNTLRLINCCKLNALT